MIWGATLLLLSGTGGRLIAADSDPAALWVSAYAWLQTGDKLAAAEQWPLATGSYLEALQKFHTLHETHPTYEVELVEYRLDALRESLAALEDRLSESDHDVTMKYLDFIESFEQGQDERFSNQLDAAAATLHVAQTLLHELTAEKPESFRAAMQSQSQMLESSMTWVESQISYKRRKPTVVAASGVDLGTTRFITAADMPADGDTILLTASLFPSRSIGTPPKLASKTPPPLASTSAPASPRQTELSTSPSTVSPPPASPPASPPAPNIVSAPPLPANPSLPVPSPTTAPTQGVLIRGFRMSSTTGILKAEPEPDPATGFTVPD
jgi:hypothetical protein